MKWLIAILSFFLTATVGFTKERFQCSINQMCGAKPETCGTVSGETLEVFSTREGMARMMFSSGHYIDLHNLGSGRGVRFDWVSDYSDGGYTALVTIFADGSLRIIDHAEEQDGSPLTSAIQGTCERIS